MIRTIDWEQVLCEHGLMVWRTAYRLLGCRADAEDCFQETFLSALRVSRRQPIANMPGLLRRLATNRALDQLRRRVAREQGQRDCPNGGVHVAQPPDPAEAAQANELAEWLRKALATLPAREAEVATLAMVEEMGNQEIAAVLGLSESAVGVLLHRARRRLHGMIARRDGGGDRR